MAPPCWLMISWSMPSSRRDWAATAAKASLISMADRSAALVLIFFQGCGDGIGRLLVEQHVRPRYEGVVFVV